MRTNAERASESEVYEICCHHIDFSLPIKQNVDIFGENIYVRKMQSHEAIPLKGQLHLAFADKSS